MMQAELPCVLSSHACKRLLTGCTIPTNAANPCVADHPALAMRAALQSELVRAVSGSGLSMPPCALMPRPGSGLGFDHILTADPVLSDCWGLRCAACLS